MMVADTVTPSSMYTTTTGNVNTDINYAVMDTSNDTSLNESYLIDTSTSNDGSPIDDVCTMSNVSESIEFNVN